MANTATEAQAPTESTVTTEAATSSPSHPQNHDHPAALDAQAQHEELARLLANPEWMPDAPTPDSLAADGSSSSSHSAGAQPRTPGSEDDGSDPGADRSADHDSDDDHAEDGAPSATSDKGKRFRFTDPADRQFAVLRKEGIAPDEAARIAYGLGHLGPVPDPHHVHSAPDALDAGDAVHPLTAMQEELQRLDQRLEDAGASEGLMSPEIIGLIQQRGDLVAEIKTESKWLEREAQAQAQAQEQIVAQARDAQEQAITVAVQRFPLLADPHSAVRQEAERLLLQYQGSAFLRDPEAPVALAEQAVANVAKAQAKAHGTSFDTELARLEARSQPGAGRGTPAKGATGTAATAAAGARKITPASGAQATLRPDQPATDADRYREAQSTLDPRAQHEALNRLLYGG